MLRESFISFTQTNLSLGKVKKVAVIGGSMREPELMYLEKMGLTLDVTLLGIDKESKFLDLNVPGEALRFSEAFDFVICCQVLEHIWNLSAAIETIVDLTRKDGLIWINCPTSNHSHGSPEYFSAGYTSGMIRKHLEKKSIEVLAEGELGSERLYKMTHSQLFWPSSTEHRNPFLRGIHLPLKLFPLRFARNFFKNLQAAGWSGKVLTGSIFSTETYIGCRKTTSRV